MRDRRKRKRKSINKPASVAQPTLDDIVKKVTAAFAEIAPDAIKRITEAEVRVKHAEDNFAFLNEKLVGLLSPDQIEAAKICGVDPAIYAINWIDLWREKIFPKDGTIGVQTLRDLHRGG